MKGAAPIERRYSVWIGGSILAFLKIFDKMRVTNGTKKEYSNPGLDLVQKQSIDAFTITR